MVKQTLLDMTQDILSSMTSDEVNSITDGDEAMSVARIIRSTYYDMISNRLVPEHKELFKLEGLANLNYPNVMGVPSNVVLIDYIKYDCRNNSSDLRINFHEIGYLEPGSFLNFTNNRNSTDADVLTVNDTTYTKGTNLLIKTNANPTYYTSFDDDNVVFDAYNSAIDSSLSSSKTQCYGTVEPTFTLSDSFIPDMDADMFPYLLNASKVTCFAEIKQQAHEIAARASRRHMIKEQNNKWKIVKANNQHRPRNGRK